jgi:D-glycero-D-manno-heptose 1,7-bisphosphate phosphatase
VTKAVFLDRDGVINRLVLNPATGEHEPPHSPEDLELFPWTPDALVRLSRAGFLLFLVSNQPDCAKGKASMDQLRAVHEKLHGILTSNAIEFAGYFYCHHHPKGINPEYSFDCRCRKPKPFFPLRAIEDHGLDSASSWFVGDRDSDIECGQRASLRTILVTGSEDRMSRGKSSPDYTASNLAGAAEIILAHCPPRS